MFSVNTFLSDETGINKICIRKNIKPAENVLGQRLKRNSRGTPEGAENRFFSIDVPSCDF